MNILGINGAIGWDGNLSTVWGNDYWVHGSGATLFIDGELKGSLSEERLSRIKYDGRYAKSVIAQLLSRNNLTEDDIDIVAHVNNACMVSYALKLQGYTTEQLSNLYPNAKIIMVDHHLAHASGSFLSSGFMESNVFSFDAAGDHHPVLNTSDENMGTMSQTVTRINNSGFYTGDYPSKHITPIQHTFHDESYNMFGEYYTEVSAYVYRLKTKGNTDNRSEDYRHGIENLKKIRSSCSLSSEIDMTDYTKNNDIMFFPPDTDIYFNHVKPVTPQERETYPGKIMGLAAYGDYTKVDLPDIFSIHISEDSMPVVIEDPNNGGRDWMFKNPYSPEDVAAWLQHQFETYLLLYLKCIPKKIKTKNLCLSGGCALNIIANTKILEEGIYEEVHVNTAPNDDGLNFGAAALLAWKNEKDLILPENMGCIGLEYNDNDIQKSFQKAGIENEVKDV